MNISSPVIPLMHLRPTQTQIKREVLQDVYPSPTPPFPLPLCPSTLPHFPISLTLRPSHTALPTLPKSLSFPHSHLPLCHFPVPLPKVTLSHCPSAHSLFSIMPNIIIYNPLSSSAIPSTFSLVFFSSFAFAFSCHIYLSLSWLVRIFLDEIG